MSVPTHLQIGEYYRLSWSSNPRALYKLLSYDHGGNCKMRSKTGKEFTTKTKDIRC